MITTNNQKKTISLEEATRIFNINKRSNNLFMISSSVGAIGGGILTAVGVDQCKDVKGYIKKADEIIESLRDRYMRNEKDYKNADRHEIARILQNENRILDQMNTTMGYRDKLSENHTNLKTYAFAEGAVTIIFTAFVAYAIHNKIKEFSHGPVYYIRQFCKKEYELKK